MQAGNPLGSLVSFACRLFAPPEEKVVSAGLPLVGRFLSFFPLLRELNPRKRSLNVGSTVLEGPQDYVLCWFIELFSFVIKMCHKLKGDKMLPFNHLLFERETEVLMVLR